MTVIELRRYIYENNKVEDILNAIGCHHVVYHKEKKYYTCGNCNGDNRNAITVKNNEYLNVVNYTRENEFKERSDLISLVRYNLLVQKKPSSFYDVIKYIHEILGLEFTYNSLIQKKAEEKVDPLVRFKMIRRSAICITNEYIALDEAEVNDFFPAPHISFVKEGIMPWSWKKFGLGYSYMRKRTMIPLRYWLTGELLGFNMRTSIEQSDLFDIKKYIITPGYQKQINIYGLWENKEEIQKAGYVVVYEAEKSVLKRDSLHDSTGVAVSGHVLSREQVSILIGLDVEIVIAFDKDIEVDYVRYCCENFYRIRSVSYIIDKDNLLNAKDSPADAKNDDFVYLLQHRIRYDQREHIEYIKNMRNDG